LRAVGTTALVAALMVQSVFDSDVRDLADGRIETSGRRRKHLFDDWRRIARIDWDELH
jgi:hypothetical protein